VFSVSSVVNYSYLPGTDILSGYTNSAGFAVTRAFEPNRDLLTAVSNRYNDATVSAFDYINDALARRTQRIDFGRAGPPDPPIINRFGYNSRSELTSAAMGTNQFGYAYDPIGNRTAATNNAETLTYLSNALNQYTNILCSPAPLREEIPVYDLDGNMTAYNGWTYAWSGENRLIQASNAQHLVTYSYDYQGRMVAKQISRRGAELGD
jgi:YD repeat-containing protein